MCQRTVIYIYIYTLSILENALLSRNVYDVLLISRCRSQRLISKCYYLMPHDKMCSFEIPIILHSVALLLVTLFVTKTRKIGKFPLMLEHLGDKIINYVDEYIYWWQAHQLCKSCNNTKLKKKIMRSPVISYICIIRRLLCKFLDRSVVVIFNYLQSLCYMPAHT